MVYIETQNETSRSGWISELDNPMAQIIWLIISSNREVLDEQGTDLSLGFAAFHRFIFVLLARLIEEPTKAIEDRLAVIFVKNRPSIWYLFCSIDDRSYIITIWEIRSYWVHRWAEFTYHH